MEDTLLTTFIIGYEEVNLFNVPRNVQILRYNDLNSINEALGKYISFIDCEDNISDNYFDIILNKIKCEEFDSCFINYKINYSFKRELKLRLEESEMSTYIPKNGEYIWNFIFNKEKLLSYFKEINKKYLISGECIEDEVFKKRSVITDLIYFHNKDGEFINICGLVNRKEAKYFKNIIYMGNFCNGLFNGYITWLREIYNAFPSLDICLIYTEINDIILCEFNKYFKCVKYDSCVDYVCCNLITTYSTYFYPMNIYSLDECSLFIHGNMADYEASARFYNDIYDRYIAVSRVSRDRAIGYFPTNNIEYIYNPYTYDKSKIKPHLKLVSALRNAPEKGIDRIKKMGRILDILNIPYTWEVFTDIVEANQGGLLFRNCVTNIIDYIQDADYLVQFSRTEALSYSLTEALSSNVKVIVCDIPAIVELGIVDGVNGIVISLDDFNDGREDILKEKILEAYRIKDKKINYKYGRSRFEALEDVFSK